MRKILPICVIGVLLLSGFGAIAINSNETKFDNEALDYKSLDNERLGYTHTVFVEVGTGQFCGPCHYWNQNLYNAYASGDYDFEYVEMIVWGFGGWNDILNMDAYNWRSIYGINSIPTSIFDGDYRKIVGNYPGQLPGALDACGSRSVKNIEGSLRVAWLGDATIKVDIEIKNNEATQYNGYIRVPITEITSRYSTSGGSKYHYGFLDWAFNKDISIGAGNVYKNSVTWNGNDHADNHGNDFGDIESDNIKVIMGVFNDDNDYVDETVAAKPGSGGAPDKPSTPNGPTEGAINIEYEFFTKTEDPQGDDVYYLFDWDDGTDSGWLGPYPSGTNQSASKIWEEEGEYEIKVIAKDENGAQSEWSNSHTINIYAGPAIDISTITGGLFRVSTKIRNPGILAATDVSWTITLEGGTILLGKKSNGEITSIPAGGEEKINSKLIIGFGRTKVLVTAKMLDGPSDSRGQGASVFLFYIKVNPGG